MLKKIIVILILITIIPSPALAENTKIYTENYYLDNENPEDYPYKSKYYITKEYETESKPKESANKVITEKVKYGYNEILTRYIVINGFTIEKEINMLEINIYNEKDNKKIEYDSICINCDNKILEDIKENNTKEEKLNSIHKAYAVMIDLKKQYNPNTITIELTFQNQKKEELYVSYNIWMLNFKPEVIKYNSKYIDAPIYKREINKINEQENYKTIKTKPQNEDIKNKTYSEEITYLEEKKEEENLFYKMQIEKKFYLYQDKLYKYYKIEIKKKDNKKQKRKQVKLQKTSEKTFNFETIPIETNESKKINKEEKQKEQKIEKEIIKETKKLSNKKIKEFAKNDKKLLVILGIFLMLISLMVYVIFKLKKEQ